MTPIVSGGSSGGSGGATLLGPFHIAFNTSGLDNPAGNGVLVGPVLPAGTLVLNAWLHTTTPWTATVSVDEFDMVLDTSGKGLLSLQTTPAVLLNSNYFTMKLGASFLTPTWLNSAADQIAVAFYSTANLTAGAGDVYALVTSV